MAAANWPRDVSMCTFNIGDLLPTHTNQSISLSFFLLFAVPPQQPKIFNERGENIETRAGPYEEGAELQLMCVVMGGKSYHSLTLPIAHWNWELNYTKYILLSRVKQGE